ncbi:MAG: hypothetical protein IKJ26_07375 [Clostridia bacterium]|nr:hypothetical protein [Clostridia bacterium]
MFIKQVKRWLPWCWLVCCFFSLCLFMHKNIDSLLNADMATEMELAHHMAQNGKWLLKDWYYGNELKIMCIQLFYIPFFLIFDNWHFVRLFGTIAAYMGLLASFYYLCSQLRIRKNFPLAASALLLPLSDIYLYIILVGGQYLPHMMLVFCVLALIIQQYHGVRNPLRTVLLCILCLLALLSGMGGVRLLLILFFPVFCCSLLLFFSLHRQENRDAKRRMFTSSALALFFCAAGCLLNSAVLSKHYSFRQYDDIILTRLDWGELVQLFNDWLELLGYPTGAALFSSALVDGLICLFSVILLVLAIRRAFQSDSPLTPPARLVILTHACGLLIMTVLIIASTAQFSPNYLIPATILTSVSVALLTNSFSCKPVIRQAAAWLMILLLAFGSIHTYQNYASTSISEELRSLTGSLVQDGYRTGFSTFWRGSTLTELSHGQLDMRVWNSEDDMNIISVNPVLQLKSHETTIPQGKTFIILSKYFNEHTDIALATWLQPEDIYWDSKDYLVYGYESYDDLLSSVNQSCASDLDGRKVAPASSASLSPIPLYPGSYTVTITGKQLDGLQIACTHSEGSLVPVQPSLADGALTFRLQTDDLLHDVQINLQNAGAQSAVLESFHLQKDSSR